MTRYDLENTLEAAIDSHGLSAVLAVLANVCAAKATHLIVNWQDDAAARPWSRAASRIDAAAVKILDSGL